MPADNALCFYLSFVFQEISLQNHQLYLFIYKHQKSLVNTEIRPLFV